MNHQSIETAQSSSASPKSKANREFGRASAAFEATARSFKRIMGHEQLWMLKAHLEASTEQEKVGVEKKAG